MTHTNPPSTNTSPHQRTRVPGPNHPDTLTRSLTYSLTHPRTQQTNPKPPSPPPPNPPTHPIPPHALPPSPLQQLPTHASTTSARSQPSSQGYSAIHNVCIVSHRIVSYHTTPSARLSTTATDIVVVTGGSEAGRRGYVGREGRGKVGVGVGMEGRRGVRTKEGGG